MRSGGSEASRARVVSTLLAIASLGLGLAAAQQSSAVPKNSSAVTGSVAGYVVYDETKLPARFTEIHLPPGSYTLEVNATDRFDSPGGPEKIRYYKTVKLAVVVGEHEAVLDDVLLNALKPGEKMDLSFPE
jgi:hypothetical protein